MAIRSSIMAHFEPELGLTLIFTLRSKISLRLHVRQGTLTRHIKLAAVFHSSVIILYILVTFASGLSIILLI